MDLRERAPEHGEVLAEDAHQSPVDRAGPGHDPVTEVSLFLEPEIVRPVFGEHVHFLEAPFIEQDRKALTGRELPLLVLILDTLFTAAQHGQLAQRTKIVYGVL